MKAIRDYAASKGFAIIGKLTRKVAKDRRYNIERGKMEFVRSVYWEDEAGNAYTSTHIITPKGDVY